MKASMTLKDFPETLCTACTGQGIKRKADLFLALGFSGKEEHKDLESALYVPFCYDHVDTARARIPKGHMANDMPDLVIEQASNGLLLKDDERAAIKLSG